MAPTPLEEAHIGASEVRSRAVTGSALIAARGLATRVLGLLSSVLVARLLAPEQVGMVAFGATLMVTAAFFADGGLAAGLLRRASPPSRRELRGILGLQLSITVAAAIIVAVVAWPFGTTGRVTALMVTALPATAWRTPALVLLERRLQYRPIAFAEILEATVFLAWAAVTIPAGLGVYGLASAWVARSAVGSFVLHRCGGVAGLRPSWDWAAVRPMLGFGLRFQAVTFVNLVRDQGLNLSVASLAGIHVLGLWSLAYRVIQVPYLLFEALWRVSFPAMARLLEAGEDPSGLLVRALRISTVGTGLVLVPFAASAPPLVPAVFGPAWEPIVPVIVLGSAGLLIAGPISVSFAGYLYAVGDAQRVLVSAVAHTLTWFAVTLPLLAPAGVVALGVGWAVGALVEGMMLVWAVRRRTSVPVFRGCGRTWLLAPVVVGLALASPAGRLSGLPAGAGVALASLAIFVIGLVVLREPGLRQVLDLARRLRPAR